MLHDTVGLMPGTLTWLADTPSPPATCSIHYLVARDGHIIQVAKDSWSAWHAGRTRWYDRAPGIEPDMSGNYDMHGIELEHMPGTEYPKEQLESLDNLIALLYTRWGYKGTVSHAEIAYPPGRKVDPELDVRDYSIEAVTERRKGEDVEKEEREMIRQARVSQVSLSYEVDIIKAMIAGDDSRVAWLEDQRDIAVARERKRLGV